MFSTRVDDDERTRHAEQSGSQKKWFVTSTPMGCDPFSGERAERVAACHLKRQRSSLSLPPERESGQSPIICGFCRLSRVRLLTSRSPMVFIVVVRLTLGLLSHVRPRYIGIYTFGRDFGYYKLTFCQRSNARPLVRILFARRSFFSKDICFCHICLPIK